MPYRGRSHPPSQGVVDVDTARRAIAQVAAERDELAQQLQRAQAQILSLQRQLQATTDDNAELAQAVRSLRAQVASRAQAPPPAPPPADDSDRVQRLAADLANLRRHQQDAIARGVRGSTDRLLLEIGAVRDAVSRALESLPGSSGAFHDGLLAVIARIDGVFEAEQVRLVGLPGERFDPAMHNAVGTVPDGEEGLVRHTVSAGLVRTDGTVISPAGVVVSVAL